MNVFPLNKKGEDVIKIMLNKVYDKEETSREMGVILWLGKR